MYKRLQEYNLSLQQYNSKLHAELEAARESLKRVEKEKATIVENLSTLRGHYNSLQDQLNLARVSFFHCDIHVMASIYALLPNAYLLWLVSL